MEELTPLTELVQGKARHTQVFISKLDASELVFFVLE